LLVISDNSVQKSSSPAKSAAKRKQRDTHLTKFETVKHRRSSAGVTAGEFVPRVDSSILCGTNSDWADTETKAAQLQLLLEHERKQSDDFEAYLRQALTDADRQKPSLPAKSTPSDGESVCDSNEHSFSEKVAQLQSSLMSEHQADRLFELQLLQICLYE